MTFDENVKRRQRCKKSFCGEKVLKLLCCFSGKRIPRKRRKIIKIQSGTPCGCHGSFEWTYTAPGWWEWGRIPAKESSSYTKLTTPKHSRRNDDLKWTHQRISRLEWIQIFGTNSCSRYITDLGSSIIFYFSVFFWVFLQNQVSQMRKWNEKFCHRNLAYWTTVEPQKFHCCILWLPIFKKRIEQSNILYKRTFLGVFCASTYCYFSRKK